MAFTITMQEKLKIKSYDFNDSYVGDRIFGFADVLLDDYEEHYGLTIDATALGIDGLSNIFIQSVDVGAVLGDDVVFDWDPTTGALFAYSEGTPLADDALARCNIRIFFIGY